MQNTLLNPIDDAARLVGGRNALATLLGVSISAIGNWKTRGVPFEQCMPIERATDGAVTRRDLRPGDYLIHWPELAETNSQYANTAINVVADAHQSIRHVQAIAVAEIKHVADELLKEPEPWDGVTDRPDEGAPWDGKTERRKLDAPIDRRVSADSVARAEFLRSQSAAKQQGV